ncbi:MAG TPA: hypothetical protein VFU02_02795 [Polyangiaceae bacterium]|nr:hypothetical protein [Polyangiaceae bacterium]
MQRLTSVVLAALALILAGCGGEDAEGSSDGGELEIDCDTESIATYPEVRAFDVCTNCHAQDREGLDRNGAPPTLNFDSYDGAAEAAARIVDQVSMGNMPPPNSGFSLSAEEQDELYVWASCGTPE